MLERLVILGVGLIGGSLARAAREAGLCREIVGWSRRAGHLQEAINLRVIDRYETDLGAAVAGADLVVSAVPPGAMGAVFASMAPHLGAETIITDVGSTKGNVVAAARAGLGAAFSRFVPGHPIAGGERNGVAASTADLFLGRRVILTPVSETEAAAVERVRWLWEGCGAEVVEMEVDHHDEVLAATSHLPHLLAFALVDTLAKLEEKQEIFSFAAGGFRDFTRIASSDPGLWHDIAMANRRHLLTMVRHFQDELNEVARAIEHDDSEGLLAVFERAKRARDQFARLLEEKMP